VALLHRVRHAFVLDLSGGAARAGGGGASGSSICSSSGVSASMAAFMPGPCALFPGPQCVQSIVDLLRSGNNPHFVVSLSREAVAGATGAIVMTAAGTIGLEYSIPRRVASLAELAQLGLELPSAGCSCSGGSSGSSTATSASSACTSGTASPVPRYGLMSQPPALSSKSGGVVSLAVGWSSAAKQQLPSHLGDSTVTMTWYQ
jgi:hypothetical protein